MKPLNSKQKKILKAIFTNPVPSSILWKDIEGLFVALGGTIRQSKGSRISVLLAGEAATFHEPHPQKETDKGAVKSVRKFLEKAGVTNADI